MTMPALRTLIHGGPVLSQNERRETHEAIVLEGDMILATGALDDMRSLAGSSARQIDIEGACVLPGLIDNHPHFLHFGSFDVPCIKLYDARNHADIFARIREGAAVIPRGEWILTTPVGEPHYFIRRSWRDLPEGRLPNRWELDAVAPDHPVWIQAYAPVTPNVCAMNSRALQLLGIGRDLPDQVDNVTIEKNADGELTGIFTGGVTNYYNSSPFWLGHVAAQVFRPTDDLWYRGALAGQLTAAGRGVTAAYEGHAMDAAHIAAYQRVRDANNLRMRVLATLEGAQHAFDFGMGITEASVRANCGLAASLIQTSDPLYRVNGLSLCPSGPGWPGILRTDGEYKDPCGRPTKGHAFLTQAMIRDTIEYCLKNNVRLNMLNCSRPEHREFLALLEPFLDQWDVRTREWVIQHSIFIEDEPIKRYAELKFHLTSTVSFCWGKGAMYQERLGEEALKYLVPIGKMFDSGANVGLGSDWGPASSFEHMALAETREFAGAGRRHDGPGYSINRQQALDGWTVNNAKLMQWEGIGALKPGYKADLAIVDRNPQTCNVGDLPKTLVLRTVLGGKDIFDTNTLPRLDEADLRPERVQHVEKGSPHGGRGHVCGPQCSHAAH
ncbi:amidohydrolase family protein [Bradyrhizobium septentrionale]|nr:amidohydrolase family protein [Bradyrhizobium septentrionale]UGY24908.1 amidohydrolase family protein [Bradyrhizobium septentrionale]